MYKYLLPTIAALAAIAAPLNAQQAQRRANITGGGDGNSGKCTVEVIVDGAADVEINGASGALRNLSGQPPQWRRFECTSPLPANAANIRFQGIDGRGRQQLIRDPRNGGAAVVRIEDPDGGAEGYTFDMIWGGAYDYSRDRRYDDRSDYDRRGYEGPAYGGAPYGGAPVAGGRFTADDAIRECRNAIRENAARRFGTPYVSFENMRIDNNPGRRDWVMGTFTVRRDRRIHEFACSVNFGNGRVRWAQIDPPGGRFGEGSADRYYPGR
jgi:hypothetical protein